MLEAIRNAAQGVVGKAIMTVVMGLIIVSFVIWGVGDMLRGFTASIVASVGGHEDLRPGVPHRLRPDDPAIPAPPAGARSPTRRRARSASTAASSSGS